MRRLILPLVFGLASLCAPSEAGAGQAGVDRLPPDVLDVVPPSALVRGEPGRMAVRPSSCRTLPTGQTRRRIVDVAVQEWAFFGFSVMDRTVDASDAARDGSRVATGTGRQPRRWRRLSAFESARVAASIAGYWAVTPEGAWIVDRQNDAWNSPRGVASRWNSPWSAAFVSWVMCEAGLGSTNQFRRAVAHHSYIDQAIRARDGHASEAAFAAYDAGETDIEPGDLLCSSRRPAYRSIAERRRQMGVGARSHCDIVVKVDEADGRVLAIGGNVRGTVSLKLFPADREAGGPLRLASTAGAGRPTFAHLKLRAESIEAGAFDSSPTVAAFGCVVGTGAPRQARADRVIPGPSPARC